MCTELFVVISGDSFCFCGIGGDTLFIIFLLHLFNYSFFSFLLVLLAVYLTDLFKNPVPGCIDFLKGFIVSLAPSVLLRS